MIPKQIRQIIATGENLTCKTYGYKYNETIPNQFKRYFK